MLSRVCRSKDVRCAGQQHARVYAVFDGESSEGQLSLREGQGKHMAEQVHDTYTTEN